MNLVAIVYELLQNGRTALMCAAHENNCEMMVLLIRSGANVDAGSLGVSVLRRLNEISQSSLASSDLLFCSTKVGWTALHIAAFWARAEAIDCLIQHGADTTLKTQVDSLSASSIRIPLSLNHLHLFNFGRMEAQPPTC